MKNRSLKILSLGLVLSMLMLCIGVLSLNNVAFAEGVQPTFESFTDTDKYYYNQNEYEIVDYEASMHKNNALNYILDENYGESGKYACTIKYAQDPATNIMRLIANGDDPITQIVPKYLFQSANNGIVHVGVEYGFFIKTEQLSDGLLLSNVFVFDFLNEFNDPTLKDHVRFKITALFQREYLYVPNEVNLIPTRSIQPGVNTFVSPDLNNTIPTKFEQTNIVIPLPYSASINLNILAESDRYYMTDIVNTFAVFNEQHLNEGDDGYDVFNDKGKFITSQALQYSATVYDPNNNGVQDAAVVIVKALFKEGVNALSKLITGSEHTFSILSTIAEALSAANGTNVAINESFPFEPEFVTAQGQIQDTGKLLRTAVSSLELQPGEHGQNSLLYYAAGDNLYSDYQLGYTPVTSESGNELKTPWEARIKRGYTFKFRSKTNGADVVTVADVHDFQKRDESGREYRALEKTQTVNLLPGGENLFSFTPEHSGNYTVKTVSADSDINLEQYNTVNSEAVTTNLTGFDQSLSMEMSAGVTYYFKTNYTDRNKCGNYTLEYDFTPQLVNIGNNNISLEYDETYIRFTSSENLNYRFTLDNLADEYHLLNSDFEVVQTSENGELLSVLNKDETYYLRIDRSSTTAKTVVLNVKGEMYVYFENIEGITNPIDASITVGLSDTVTLPTPEKQGYTFDGWWTELSQFGENITNQNIFDYIQLELHLYAKWTPIHYTIFYEENGGETIPDGDYIVEHTVTLNQNITKNGYVFCGWYDNAAFSGTEIKTLPTGSIGNKTFYARWVKEKFTIRFDMNSEQTDGFNANFDPSDNIVGNQKEVFYKQPYTLPTPSLIGFTFDGWFYQGNLVTANNLYEYENDIELVAKWLREKYRIKIGLQNENGVFSYQWLNRLNNNDLTFNEHKEDQIEYNELCPNNYVDQLKLNGQTNQNNTFLGELYKVGHQFSSFVFDASATNPKVFDWSTLTKEEIRSENVIVLEAYYVREKEFKIYVEDVTGVTGAQHNLPIKDFNEVIDYGTAPTKTGYTFSGYVVSNNKHNSRFGGELAIGSQFNFSKMPDLSQNREMDGEIIYIEPVFTPNTYLVTFDVEGIQPKNVTFDTAYNTSSGNAFAVPEKKGYDFNGWAAYENGTRTKKTDSNGNTLNGWDIAEDCTLYADFIPKLYILTIDPQNGDENTYVVVSYDCVLPKLTYNIPILKGNTFQGYYEFPNCAGKKYYESDLTSNVVWTHESNKTIYGGWNPNLYKVILDFNDASGRNKEFETTYGKEMNLFTVYAPIRVGYSFAGAFENSNGTGTQYYYSDDLLYCENDNRYYENFKTNMKWNHASDKIIYAAWKPNTMTIKPYFYSSDHSWSYEIEKKITTGTSLTLTAPQRDGYKFENWMILEYDPGNPDNNWNIGQNSRISKDQTVRETMQVFLDTNGTLASRFQFVAQYVKIPPPETCVVEGTLITLADGTQKAVEDLTGSEQLLVWNLFTGSFDTAPILFIDHDPVREYEVISLMFSDGTTVKVISEHGFWDFDLNEYVFLRSDAAKYIGHWFNKQSTDENGNFSYTRVQLTNVIVQNGFTSAWSPVTYGHLCYYVNGMLSMPGATTGLINIFNVDTDTMKIDETKYYEDIAEYGLFTYEEFSAIYPVPEVIFEAFGGQYLKVAMGKGLLTEEMLESLIARYAVHFNKEA